MAMLNNKRVNLIMPLKSQCSLGDAPHVQSYLGLQVCQLLLPPGLILPPPLGMGVFGTMPACLRALGGAGRSGASWIHGNQRKYTHMYIIYMAIYIILNSYTRLYGYLWKLYGNMLKYGWDSCTYVYIYIYRDREIDREIAEKLETWNLRRKHHR